MLLSVSGLLYYYYDSVAFTQYSLLTSSVKSVVAWNMVFGSTAYASITFSQLSWSEEEDIATNNTETCYKAPSMAATTLATALLEFQFLRVLFELYPYAVLDLNADVLAYPLAASVPILSCSMHYFAYTYEGTLCDQLLTNIFLFKLNENVNTDMVPQAYVQLRVTMWTLITASQVFITLYRKWKNKNFNNHIRNRRNRIAPAYMNAATQPADLDAMVAMGLSSVMLYCLTNIIVKLYIGSVLFDCLCLGLSTYWLVASIKVTDFIKLKMNQMKLRYGYY